MTPDRLDNLASAILDGDTGPGGLANPDAMALVESDPYLHAQVSARVAEFRSVQAALATLPMAQPASVRDAQLATALTALDGGQMPVYEAANEPTRGWKREWFALAAGVVLALGSGAFLLSYAQRDRAVESASSVIETEDDRDEAAEAVPASDDPLVIPSDGDDDDAASQPPSTQEVADAETDAGTHIDALVESAPNDQDNAEAPQADGVPPGPADDATEDDPSDGGPIDDPPPRDEPIDDPPPPPPPADDGGDVGGPLWIDVTDPLVRYRPGDAVTTASPVDLIGIASSPETSWGDPADAACASMNLDGVSPTAFVPLDVDGVRHELLLFESGRTFVGLIKASGCQLISRAG